MSVRKVTINGKHKVWMARISVHGVRRSKVCESYAEAKQAERDLAAECREQADQQQGMKAAPATMKQLLEHYVQMVQARGQDEEGRFETTAIAVERLAPTLLAMPVSKVQMSDLYDFRAARLRGGAKPATVNRDLKNLRAALRLVRPAFSYPKGLLLPEDETRVRFLTPDHETLVFGAMRSPMREIARLAEWTLMRLSEIRLLRREDVHLDQGLILLPKAKAGSRAVVLSGDAQKLLRTQLEQHTSEWVFPGPSGKPYGRHHISREFRLATRAAGLRDFHFHDLRHHGATVALNKRFSSAIVMSLGGWKSERMMRRYAAVTNDTLRAAAEAVSGNTPWQSPVKPRRRSPSPRPAGAGAIRSRFFV
jgi:integrase